MADTLSVEVDAAVATVRLDRPPMNALDAALQDRIHEVALELGGRDDVRAVVLYGGPKVFAAGADIKEMAGLSYSDMAVRSRRLQAAFDAVARILKPVFAAITGYALGGGCELALTADFRICAEDARLGQPEILLGLIPGAGGTQRLSRLIGPARAKDLIFTGRHVDAREALALGLVDAVVPAEEVHAEAVRRARRFAAGPAMALRAAKSAVDDGLETDLNTGLRLESELFAGLFATRDREIGMQSFLEKGPGKAEFTGR